MYTWIFRIIGKSNMKIARKRNTITGSIWGILNRSFCIILPFIIRTIIIYKFGEQYLGLNSLFTSILRVLSLSDLGITSAVVYYMYKPIAEDDYETLSALMLLYKRVYFVIGIIITVIGLLLIPVLPKLINGDYPPEINIYILYIIYLVNTSVSYFFFAYKECILTAYQRNDIINIVRLVTYGIQFLVQIVILLVLKNYYMYTAIMIISTLSRGFLNSFIVNRKYPFIKCCGRLDKKAIGDIKYNMFGITLERVCTVSRGTCDDIIISASLGLSALTVFDNYYYILSAVSSIMTVIEGALIAGVGNSIVTETIDKNFYNYKKINFIYMWLAGWCSICMICLYQPFMRLWVGSKLMINRFSMILFCVYFLVASLSSVSNVYSTAAGLWFKMKTKSILEVVLNLVMNIIFVNFFGINGILVATIITLLFINFIYGSKVLFDNYFIGISIKEIIIIQIKNVLLTIFIAVPTYLLTLFFKNKNGWISIIIPLIICLIIPNLLFAILLKDNIYFKEYRSSLKKIIG